MNVEIYVCSCVFFFKEKIRDGNYCSISDFVFVLIDKILICFMW